MSNWERIRELMAAVRNFDLIIEAEKKKLKLDVITPEASLVYLIARWIPIREMLDGLKEIKDGT